MIQKYCPNCLTTLSSFYKTGMLGCPECYKVFEREILITLKKIQGGTFHVGKKPTVSEEDKGLINEYRHLLAEKERAGIEGRFMEMAKLSERIAELNETLKRRGLI